MVRKLLSLLLLLLPSLLLAQTTTVTGTVVDPNGNPYFPGTVSAYIILNSGQALPPGVPASGSIGPFPTTAGGNFSVTVASPLTWQFTICGAPVNIGPRANAIPTQICFPTVAIAISGASQSITANLPSPIPLLGPNVGNAVTSVFSRTGTVISQTGDYTCAQVTGCVQAPLPNNGIYYLARATVANTSLQTLGDASTAVISAGSASIANGAGPNANEGVSDKVSSGSTINSYLGWLPVNNGIFWAGRNCRYQARARFPTVGDTTPAQAWFGFSDQTPDALRTPTGNIVAMLEDQGTWKGVIYNAGVLTSLTLSATPDTVTHTLDIIMNDAGNNTKFYIDGVLQGTITGHNPSALAFWPTFTLINKIASTANVNFQYMYAQQDF